MVSTTTIFITGANSGIGYQTIRALLQSERTYTIFLGSRSTSRGEKAIEELKAEFPDSKSTIQLVEIDVTKDASIKTAFDQISAHSGVLDVLVNNAGTSFDIAIAKGEVTTREGWAASWDLNVTSAHIMNETFVPLLLKSKDPRILFTTSGTSSLEETENFEAFPNLAPAAGWPKKDFNSIISYRTSKIGLNMLMKEWAKVLRHDGVKLFCVAPGFLATGFGGSDKEQMRAAGAQDPSLGGISLRKVIEGERDADVFKVVRNYSTPVQPW